MRRAIFLDRDGVLNRKAKPHHYICEVKDLVLLPGCGEAVARLNRAGWVVIVVTNQRGVSRGHLDHGALQEIHRKLRQLLGEGGGRIDGLHYCPCGDEATCACRKPSPEMLLRGAERFDVDLKASWMVGDSPSDIEAGRRAGCRTLFIGDAPQADADAWAPSLPKAVDLILAP